MAMASSGARTTDARTNQQDHNPKHGRRVRVKMCVSAATAVDVVLSIACISPSCPLSRCKETPVDTLFFFGGDRGSLAYKRHPRPLTAQPPAGGSGRATQ